MKGARRVREAARENGTAPTVVTASRADFHRPPQPLIAAFIDDQRAAGHAVESICRVLHEQGCQIAARTYRVWREPGPRVALVAARLGRTRLIDNLEFDLGGSAG